MKRPLYILAIVLLVICTAAVAQQPQPMPQIVLAAQTVYVTSYGAPSWMSGVLPEDKKAVGDVVTALQKWGRYEVVFDPARADLIIAVEKRGNGDTFSVYQGRTAPGVKSIALWREMRVGGLDSNELPSVTNFRKAVEAAEKDRAQ